MGCTSPYKARGGSGRTDATLGAWVAWKGNWAWRNIACRPEDRAGARSALAQPVSGQFADTLRDRTHVVSSHLPRRWRQTRSFALIEQQPVFTFSGGWLHGLRDAIGPPRSAVRPGSGLSVMVHVSWAPWERHSRSVPIESHSPLALGRARPGPDPAPPLRAPPPRADHPQGHGPFSLSVNAYVGAPPRNRNVVSNAAITDGNVLSRSASTSRRNSLSVSVLLCGDRDVADLVARWRCY